MGEARLFSSFRECDLAVDVDFDELSYHHHSCFHIVGSYFAYVKLSLMDIPLNLMRPRFEWCFGQNQVNSRTVLFTHSPYPTAACYILALQPGQDRFVWQTSSSNEGFTLTPNPNPNPDQTRPDSPLLSTFGATMISQQWETENLCTSFSTNDHHKVCRQAVDMVLVSVAPIYLLLQHWLCGRLFKERKRDVSCMEMVKEYCFGRVMP